MSEKYILYYLGPKRTISPISCGPEIFKFLKKVKFDVYGLELYRMNRSRFCVEDGGLNLIATDHPSYYAFYKNSLILLNLFPKDVKDIKKDLLSASDNIIKKGLEGVAKDKGFTHLPYLELLNNLRKGADEMARPKKEEISEEMVHPKKRGRPSKPKEEVAPEVEAPKKRGRKPSAEKTLEAPYNESAPFEAPPKGPLEIMSDKLNLIQSAAKDLGSAMTELSKVINSAKNAPPAPEVDIDAMTEKAVKKATKAQKKDILKVLREQTALVRSDKSYDKPTVKLIVKEFDTLKTEITDLGEIEE